MRYFLFDHTTDQFIDAQHPVVAETRSEALDAFADMSGVDGNHFGLVTDDEEVLQVAFLGGGSYELDVPQPDRHGSLTRLVSLDQCREALRAVIDGELLPSEIAGLSFAPWEDAGSD